MSKFMNAFDRAANGDILHYGVKGMQWGVVNEYQPVGNTPAARPQNQPQQQAQQPPQEQQNQMTPEQEEKAREMAEKIAAENRKAARKKALKIAGLVTAGVAVAGIIGYSIYRNKDAIKERNAERKQRFDDRIDAKNDLRNARYDSRHVSKNSRFENKTARIQNRANAQQARADRATLRRDTALDIRTERRNSRIDRRDYKVSSAQYTRKFEALAGLEEQNRHSEAMTNLKTKQRTTAAMFKAKYDRLINRDEEAWKNAEIVGRNRAAAEYLNQARKHAERVEHVHGTLTYNAAKRDVFDPEKTDEFFNWTLKRARVKHDDLDDDNHLEHSGVVGMKWGVRKEEQQAIDDEARVEAAAQEAAQKIEEADKQKVRKAVMIGAAVGLGTATVAIVGGLIAKKTKNAPERRRTEGVRDVLNEAGAEKGAKLYNMVHK